MLIAGSLFISLLGHSSWDALPARLPVCPPARRRLSVLCFAWLRVGPVEAAHIAPAAVAALRCSALATTMLRWLARCPGYLPGVPGPVRVRVRVRVAEG